MNTDKGTMLVESTLAQLHSGFSIIILVVCVSTLLLHGRTPHFGNCELRLYDEQGGIGLSTIFHPPNCHCCSVDSGVISLD